MFTRYARPILALVTVAFLFILITGCGGSGSGSSGGAGSNAAPTVALVAAPASIASGGQSTLTWTSTNATSVSISPSVSSSPLSLNGSVTVSPAQTTTYTITATGAGGTSTATATVTISGAAPTVTLAVSPTSINAGALSTLTWTSTNATSVSISPAVPQEDVSTVPLNGSVTISPAQTTTYTITANGPGGTASATATLTVVQVPPTVQLTLTPSSIATGQSSVLSWSTTNATSLSIDQNIGPEPPASGSVTVSPATTTTYTATATGPGGTSTATATLTVSNLSISLSASPQNLTAGQSSTITYTSQNAVSITVDNNVGSEPPPNGTFNVTPAATTTYTATATDANGVTQTAKVTVFVGGGISTLKHIIYMVQENRSFDSYFGKLGVYKAAHGYTNDVEGVPNDAAYPLKDQQGNLQTPYHYKTTCTEDLTSAWNESHYDADYQSSSNTFLMDNFMQTTNSVPNQYDPGGHRAMGYYTDADLPYYYELATQFAVGDHTFSPVMANTIPNRMYLFAGTSAGEIYPNQRPQPWPEATIFRALTNAGISWRYYYQDSSVFLAYYSDWDALKNNVYPISDYFNVLNGPNPDGNLPQVIFIERAGGAQQPNTPIVTTDEHPLHDVQHGAATVKTILDAFMASPVWLDSAFILTYDEGGGLFDHVPPQPMPPPDSTAPIMTGEPFNVLPGQFNQTGFRVPFIVVSPWVKPHYTSKTVRDTTAILKFIETRFNIPPLTARDAAQDDLTEFFDFTAPSFATPPTLPAQPVLYWSTSNECPNQNLEAQ